jgi:hypothetical protein
MNILRETYITLVDWIKDLRETRKQLIWMATFLFMWSVIHGVDTTVLLTVAGLLTIVWGFYFAGTNSKYKQEHEKWVVQNTKIVAPMHDPDKD